MSRWDAVWRWGTPSRRSGVACGLAVGLATGAGRWWVRAGAAPLFWNDSADYVAAAHLPLWSADRLVGTRPILMPLVLSLASEDLSRLTLVHVVVASACWGLLAAIVAVSVRSWAARVVGSVGVLALSSVWVVSMWDQQVLTESLALSGLAACVAAALWFANRPSARRAAVLVLACATWLISRDSHAIPVALGGLVLVAVAWRLPGGRRRLLAVTGAYLLALSFLVVASASAGERNLVPLEHVYAARVLPFPDRVAWFEEHGMPLASELEAIPEARDPVKDLAPFTPVSPDARWAPWRRWLREDGQATLLRYWATHPTYLLSEPQRRPERVFNNGDGLPTYEPLERRPIPGVDALADVSTGAVVFVAAAAMLGILVIEEERRRLVIVGAFTLVSAFPHALAVWHLDGMESARHLLIPALQARIATLLLLVALVDGLLSVRGTDRSPLARWRGRPRAPGPRRA